MRAIDVARAILDEIREHGDRVVKIAYEDYDGCEAEADISSVYFDDGQIFLDDNPNGKELREAERAKKLKWERERPLREELERRNAQVAEADRIEHCRILKDIILGIKDNEGFIPEHENGITRADIKSFLKGQPIPIRIEKGPCYDEQTIGFEAMKHWGTPKYKELLEEQAGKMYSLLKNRYIYGYLEKTTEVESVKEEIWRHYNETGGVF